MNLHDPKPRSAMSPTAPEYGDEAERLRVLDSYEAAAIEDDPELQAIVAFAAKLCRAPVSMVSLIKQDTQHFLARDGIDQRETDRDVAFCIHTLGKDEMLEVPDATRDDRFADNPLVTGPANVRYYAGQPLVSEEGASLGTLCVIDTEARDVPLEDFQREGLRVLAQAAMRRLAARRIRLSADRAIAEREERLRRVLEGLPQIAWSADEHGNFDYFNKRWAEQTGAPPPGSADAWRPFIHPDDADRVLDEWQRCLDAGKSFEAEYRLRQADGSWFWMLGLGVPVSEHEGDPVRWFGTVTDIDEVRRALEERDLLAHELSHRIKNLFAVVIGLATLKARKDPAVQPFVAELTDVLRALGRANEFVRAGHASVSHDALRGLLGALFKPYRDGSGEDRVRITGDDVPVGAAAATPLALVFHELATNAAKYGALSVDEGHVTLTMTDEGETVHLTWQEHGGPAVIESGETGFGSRLVEMSVTGQLGGSWQRHFRADGLVIDLTVSKAAIAR
ncbi:hypothetical protein GCM10011411_20400 [Aurantiacibacter arachoides]|nr:hypothetical protein GCM10011411_20400 [Aurantiacibacter arachoides]